MSFMTISNAHIKLFSYTKAMGLFYLTRIASIELGLILLCYTAFRISTF